MNAVMDMLHWPKWSETEAPRDGFIINNVDADFC